MVYEMVQWWLVHLLRSLVTIEIYRNISGYKISRLWIAIVSVLYATGVSFLPTLGFYLLLFLMVAMSIYFDRLMNWKMGLFYSFYPIIVDNLFRYVILYNVLPNLGFLSSDRVFYRIIASLLVYPTYYFMMRVIKIDLPTLRIGLERNFSKHFIYLANIAMGLYFIVIQSIKFLDLTEGAMRRYAMLLNLTYLILFFMMLVYINVTFKEMVEEEMEWQKDRQIQDLSNYSHQIESLYTEVRRFRHDYLNLLSSLELAIENEDIEAIRSVYDSVLKGTGDRFKDSKYSLGNLVNVENDAVKSILSAKLIQAQDKGISTSVEVSQQFTNVPMELSDFIILLSVFLDNAIEAAEESDYPKISLALVQTKDRQVVIVENSIKEESQNVNTIFQEGVSSKGEERGIGLSTVSTVLSRYPRLTLKTVSHNYIFKQILEI